MKKLFLLWFAGAIGFSAMAQPGEDLASVAADRERERINAERMELEARFNAEEAACYKKFAVNRCLNAIKPLRREAMAQLRLQEVALNDQKRKQKAAEQIQKIEEKSSPEVLQQAAERRTKALQDAQARTERSQTKADERLDLQKNEALNAASAADKAKGSQERAQARADKRAAAAEEREKYNEKQQEVAEKKAANEKKRREQTKPPAPSLPTPN
ncbi:hypothetical protein [Polaromonas sp. UC242_47]|uniref:hypothetical protein n=1 Tax=Polaromonas sp. UC242_47 TaxID=3374626 RepID=UPI0037A6C0F6